MLQKSAIALVFTVLALSACVRPPGYHRAVVYYQHGDYAAAFRAFRPIAEQGYAKAQYTLGLMYDMGQGVPQDYGEAMKWYRKAAEQGVAESQHNLGLMYYGSQGVSKNYVLAHMWFSVAAMNGHKKSQKGRDHLVSLMSPAQITEAEKLVQEWMAKHEK